VGDAKITMGYRLPAKYVIHTVGPVWRGGDGNEQELLASCYIRSLNLAAQHGVTTIAFPCISTGVFSYPFELATIVAIDSVKTAQNSLLNINEVIFCCFSKGDLEIYLQHLD
jgi:O-acetyl-ADP-ribose deacetylase (regulator of RNase III)